MTYGKLSLQFWDGTSMLLPDVAVEQRDNLLIITDRAYGSTLAYSLDRIRAWDFADDAAPAVQSNLQVSSVRH